MKFLKILSKRGLALFLVLTMCISLLPSTALAAELSDLAADEREPICGLIEHEHSEECYTVKSLTCGVEENHVHSEDCYTETKSETPTCGLEEHEHSEECYAPEEEQDGESEKIPEAVQAFLTAAGLIPQEITADNADDAQAKANEAITAYDSVSGADRAREDVVAALKAVQAALDAIKATRKPQIPEGATMVEPVRLYRFYSGDCADLVPADLFTSVANMYGPEGDDFFFPRALYILKEDGKTTQLDIMDYAAIFAAPYLMELGVEPEIDYSQIPMDPVAVTPEAISYQGTPVTVYFYQASDAWVSQEEVTDNVMINLLDKEDHLYLKGGDFAKSDRVTLKIGNSQGKQYTISADGSNRLRIEKVYPEDYQNQTVTVTKAGKTYTGTIYENDGRYWVDLKLSGGSTKSYNVYCYTLIPGATGQPNDVWNGMGLATVTGTKAPTDYTRVDDKGNGSIRIPYGEGTVTVTLPTTFPPLTFDGVTYQYAPDGSENATKEGYYTIKWNSYISTADGANTGKNGYNTPFVNNGTNTFHLDGQVTLIRKNKYTVSFLVQEPGQPFEIYQMDTYSKSVDAGFYESALTVPPLQGTTREFNGLAYRFDGWYLDEGCTQKANFNGTIQSNTNYYGRYVANTATITYDLNGGKIDGKTDNVVYENQKIGEKTPDPGVPVKADHRFLGWEPEVAQTVAGNATYVAQWVELISIQVTKVWDDNNDQDGLRSRLPNGTVTIHLKANDADTGKSIDLTAGTVDKDGNWTGAFTNLDAVDANGAINYTVEEDVPSGYSRTITGNATDGFTITNTHTPATINVSVVKVWDDDEATDARPKSIQIQLKAQYKKDGPWQEVGTPKTVAPDGDGEWLCSFDSQPKYANGQEIKYSIEEVPVPGYTKVPNVAQQWVNDGETLEFTVTNTKDPTQTQNTKYTVKHVVAGVEQEGDTKTYNGTAWINETNPTIAIEEGSLARKSYTGYKFEKIEGAAEDATSVASGTTITLSYVRDDSVTKPTSYTVKYTIEGVEQPDDGITVNGTAWINDDPAKIAIAEGGIPAPADKYDGYKLDPTNPEYPAAGTEVNSGAEYTVNYLPRTDLTYTVNYYLEGTTDKVAESKVVENQTFGASVPEEAIEITNPNYMLAEGEQRTKTVRITTGENVINFYYTVDRIGEGDPTEPDGIPDKYQTTVTFTVVNGTWTGGGTTRSIVRTLYKDGVMAADGSYTLTGDDIPNGTPDQGYSSRGNWDHTPLEVVVYREGAAFRLAYPIAGVPTPPPPPAPGGTDIPENPTPLGPGPDGVDIEDEDVPLANAVGLNDTDHFADIIGYDDDTVKPLKEITRAEAVTIFFRLMEDEYRTANWSTENTFSDVNVGNWYNNAVSTCLKAGVLEHFAQDEKFLPNQAITRAEFASIAAGFVSDEITGEEVGDFSDTEGHWASLYIRKAVQAGWIEGVGCNRFAPDETITRAQVMTMVNRMLDRVPDAEHMLPTMKKWIDNPEGKWYYEAVQEATNAHEYKADEQLGVETWTELKEARDWKELEEQWAANGGSTNPVDPAPVDPTQPVEGESEDGEPTEG